MISLLGCSKRVSLQCNIAISVQQPLKTSRKFPTPAQNIASSLIYVLGDSCKVSICIKNLLIRQKQNFVLCFLFKGKLKQGKKSIFPISREIYDCIRWRNIKKSHRSNKKVTKKKVYFLIHSCAWLVFKIRFNGPNSCVAITTCTCHALSSCFLCSAI